MKRHILAGLVLALLTTAIVLFSGPELQGVALLGAALGGALGLVPDRSPAQRAAGFAVGFLAAWLGYALRAAVLPDAAAGRAIAVLSSCCVCLGGRRPHPRPAAAVVRPARCRRDGRRVRGDLRRRPVRRSSPRRPPPRRRSCSPPEPASWPRPCSASSSCRTARRSVPPRRAAESPLFAPTEPPVGEYEGAGNHAARPPVRHPSLRPPAGGLTCDARPPPRPHAVVLLPLPRRHRGVPRARRRLAATSPSPTPRPCRRACPPPARFQGARVYEQLALTGHGTATIEQPRLHRRACATSTASAATRWSTASWSAR